MRTICLIILVFTFSLTSCSDFLNVKPKDTKTLKYVEDYRDLLAPYMAFLKTNDTYVYVWDSYYPGPWDPCISTVLPGYIGEIKYIRDYNAQNGQLTDTYKEYYAWKDQSTKALWTKLYKLIGPLNMIIGELPHAEGNNEMLRDMVQGEALYWRAYSFFKLLQYFSPYKNNKLGVPIFLETHIDAAHANLERKTQLEGYQQVIRDCEEGLKLLTRTQPSTSWNFAYKPSAFHALLAATYHYKAKSGAAESTDWENAAKHAASAMTGRRLTSDPKVLKDMFDLYEPTFFENDEFDLRIVQYKTSGERVFGFFAEMYGGNPIDNYYRSWIAVPEVYALFSEQDVRRDIWFTTSSIYSPGTICNNKYRQCDFRTWNGGGMHMPFRLAELYLIRAEALAEMGETGEARRLLQEFTDSRYSAAVSIPSDKEQLLKMIYAERKREFLHELDINFLDMKRLQKRYVRNIRGMEFIIEGDAFQYTFPIPFEEVENNPNINENNPGWDLIVTK